MTKNKFDLKLVKKSKQTVLKKHLRTSPEKPTLKRSKGIQNLLEKEDSIFDQNAAKSTNDDRTCIVKNDSAPLVLRKSPSKVFSGIAATASESRYDVSSLNIANLPMVPAYLRYSGLVPETLKLPSKFDLLLKVFQAIDSTCIFAKSRNQSCIFHKAKKSIENIVRRTIDIYHVRCIEKIYPSSIDLQSIRILHEGKKIDSLAIRMQRSDDQIIQIDGRDSVPFSQRELLKRQSNFRSKLIEIVKSHHMTFLQERDIDISDAIVKWHPDFDLDSVPDIELAKNEVPVVSNSVEKVPNNHLKPTTLLERIREKEKKNKIESMLGSSSTTDKNEFQRLSALCSSLSFLFSSMKKSAMFLGDVTERLAASAKVVTSPDEIQKQIESIAIRAPQYIQILRLSTGTTLKLDKSFSLHDVQEILQKSFE